MGTYKRLPRVKSKATNEIATWLEVAHRWMNVNWRHVLSGLGIVVAATIVVLLVSNYLAKRDEKAGEMYFQATKAAEGSEQAITAYENLIKSHPRAGVTAIGRLRLGSIWFSRGNYDKAEEILTPLTKAGDPTIRILGLHNVASVLMAKGDAKGAAELYLKAYADTKNPARGVSYFNAAMAYKEAGHAEEAKKIYEELIKEETPFSNPSLREKSKEQLIWPASLNGQN